MPFLDEITSFINNTLKAGSLNSEKLQPAKYYGLATTDTKSGKAPGAMESFPAIVDGVGNVTMLTPDSKLALQVYHRVLGKSYGYEKKSYGDDYLLKCTADMQMVVITNSKLTRKAKEALEPAFIYGWPQKLSSELLNELGINKCSIAPVASNMDALSVFRQEYPQTKYFLNERMSMMAIRYRIEETFSQQCIQKCLC